MPAAARKPAPAPSKKARPSRRPRGRKSTSSSRRKAAYRVAAVNAAPETMARRVMDEIGGQLRRAYRLVTVDPRSVVEEASARGLHVGSLAELRALPQPKRDALATTFIKSAKIWATGHGTSLGAAGLVTVAADIAALVALNLRMVQHVALSYGVEPAHERLDAWAILLAALGETSDPRAARHVELSEAPAMAARLIGETARLFTERLLKGAGRAVPVVGAVFGGLSNYAFTARVATKAREFYKSLAP